MSAPLPHLYVHFNIPSNNISPEENVPLSVVTHHQAERNQHTVVNSCSLHVSTLPSFHKVIDTNIWELGGMGGSSQVRDVRKISQSVEAWLALSSNNHHQVDQ